MRLVIVGAGGTGGYFGAKLAKAGTDVTFRKLVLALGVERSKALLADVERKLAAIVGG